MNFPVSSQDDAGQALQKYSEWDGSTYYGRAQLKSAPFENLVVGGYIFLAGLSGSAAILAALADLAGGKSAASLVRRGRYLGLLAPVIGSALLVYDLHTPKRFYNMLRVAKSTSPMSIGTWILVSFSASVGLSAAAQAASDFWPQQRWSGWTARVFGVPAAIAGMGMSTYTASLLAATSTPLWAAAPQALAVRFGASSMAAAASALSLGEPSDGIRPKLDAITGVALATEAVAAMVLHEAYGKMGVRDALDSPSGRLEKAGATQLGVVLPLGLLAVSALAGRHRRGGLSGLAALAVLAGSAMLRVSVMGAGDVSAERPDVSFRFTQPRNMPRR